MKRKYILGLIDKFDSMYDRERELTETVNKLVKTNDFEPEDVMAIKDTKLLEASLITL